MVIYSGQFLDGMVQQAALPPDMVCHLCGNDASVMCCQCGPHAYFCTSCAEQLHMKTNHLIGRYIHKLLCVYTVYGLSTAIQ